MVGPAQVQANELVLASGKEKAAGQRRIGAHSISQDLGLSQFVIGPLGSGQQHQLPILLENHQLVSRQEKAAGSEMLLAPAHFAGAQFDTAQAGPELLTAMESVEETFTLHAGGVMIRKGVIRGPKALEFACGGLQKDGARFIAGGQKDQ